MGTVVRDWPSDSSYVEAQHSHTHTHSMPVFCNGSKKKELRSLVGQWHPRTNAWPHDLHSTRRLADVCEEVQLHSRPPAAALPVRYRNY